MPTIKVTEDFATSRLLSYDTLQEAIEAFGKFVDWGMASWSRRVELLDNKNERMAIRFFKSPTREEWTLEQTVKRIRELGGDEAVDRYLDLHEPEVPWEFCIGCEAITPRNPETVKCVYLELHE